MLCGALVYRFRIAFVLAHALAIFVPTFAAADTVTLAWDAPSSVEGVAGYVIWYGKKSGHYTEHVKIGLKTSHKLEQLQKGVKYYFAVQAYNTAGTVSELSSEVSGAGLTAQSTTPPSSEPPPIPPAPPVPPAPPSPPTPTSPRAPVEWFVAPGEAGSGTSQAPFNQIQLALNAAQPGDTITVRTGTYPEAVRSVRHGLAERPIRIRAANARGPVVMALWGHALHISHRYLVIEGLTFDGLYQGIIPVRVETAADFLILRNIEVRRARGSLIHVENSTGVLIEDSLVHRALDAGSRRADAHGILARDVGDLTIRNTEIHTVSGNGVHLDATDSTASVVLERCRIWAEPLASAENGFKAGAVPGSNAVGTQARADTERSTLVVRDTTVRGYRRGLRPDLAAFNVEQNVAATLDGVTVHDVDVAFRVRGPDASGAGAWATIQNAVIHNTSIAFRYEQNVETLNVWNNTIGLNVSRVFQAVLSSHGGLDVRNLLALQPLSAEAAGSSNRTVGADAFVNPAAHNYALAPGSPAVDAGDTIAEVADDRSGGARPQGAGYDIGAYEQVATTTAAQDIIIHAANKADVFGNWQVVSDSTAASRARLWHRNRGAAEARTARTAPTDYFEVQAWVEAGQPYRLWLRGQADDNSSANDSVFVQFSGAVTTAGTSVFRIGTTSAAVVSFTECATCKPAKWAWRDHGAHPNALGEQIVFQHSGMQTIRIQTREDGVSIDQIVLSPATYLTAAPGASRKDKTILPES